MRDATEYGSIDLVDRFIASLHGVLPHGVTNRVDEVQTGSDSDWQLLWTAGRSTLRLHLEVKVHPPRAAQRPEGRSGMHIDVLISSFLSRQVRHALESAGWSYWDATGNMLLVAQDPLIVIRAQGAEKDPAPTTAEPTKLRSLKGRAASEVVVALLGNGSRAASVRDFARDQRLPLATVSRVFALLRDENLLTPTGGGPIVVKDPIALAQRWTDDYSFEKTFHARRYFSILGTEFATTELARSDLAYAVTGVQAAQAWLAHEGRAALLPSTDLWLYTADVHATERLLDLAPAPHDGPILVAEAGFLSREQPWYQGNGLRTVAPWRVAGDLMSRHGRQASVGLALADSLLGDRRQRTEHFYG